MQRLLYSSVCPYHREMDQGFRVIRQGSSFAVEGYFVRGQTQTFASASGFNTEAEARAWVYAQQEKDDQAAEEKP